MLKDCVEHQYIGFIQICSNGVVTTSNVNAIAAFLKTGLQVIVLAEQLEFGVWHQGFWVVRICSNGDVSLKKIWLPTWPSLK